MWQLCGKELTLQLPHVLQSINAQQGYLKGGHLDFSHLTVLKNIYITEIYMKKRNKSSINKKHKMTKKKNFYGVKRLHSLLGYF